MRESRASVLEPGTLFADRYEVVRKLGEGGMGIVYVAKDTNTGEEMVLKLIHPDLVTGDEAVKRLMAEGLTARQIRHPNIVAVYDVAQSNGQPYFTMEYVKGGSLRSWMVDAVRTGRETALDPAVGLVRSMLAGLAEAHRMGIVHRDLKPENVLLCGDPRAGDYRLKILDFGIARAIGGPTTRSSGGAIGTPLYMAPEQMTSADAVGPAADLYSLTVMFYELLMEALPQARWEPVGKSRPGIPATVDALIEKGLSVRPRSRFQSAAEYWTALDLAMAGRAPIPTPTPDPPTPPEPVRPPSGGWSSTTKMMVGGAAALIVAFSVVIANWPTPTIQPVKTDDRLPILQGGDDETQPPEKEKAEEPPPPPPPPPPVFNASGTWWADDYTTFTVQHDGRGFQASGVMGTLGPVTLRGVLTTAGMQVDVYYATTGALALRGSGQVTDARHIAYVLEDGRGNSWRGRLHINHQPTS